MDATRRNRSFGWWSLLCWLSLGMVLEALHGFKVGWYLDVVNEARRLQLSLAHTHGTLIALANLLFAATARPHEHAGRRLARASWCLVWAGVSMPLGFLGGGLLAMGPDPGLPVVLVPIGGLLLFAGVLLAALAARAPATATAPDAAAGPGTPAPTMTRQERRAREGR